MSLIQAPRGAEDILPPDSDRFRTLETKFFQTAARFGYQEIRTPIFEEAALFEKGTGETTDLVTKEMYVFRDRGGRILALRPEGTPSVVRAVVEHHLLKQSPVCKLVYAGPMFRYERPQKGRGRQFHQVGAEFIGASDPFADTEIIHFLVTFIQECHITDFRVLINNLGCFADRSAYARVLAAYLEEHRLNLAEVDRERLHRNPFRVLDSKEAQTRAFLANQPDLPRVEQFVCDACRHHHSRVLESLTLLDIPFEEVPTLVRGLDYYERTVFEVVSPRLGSQDALGGGGRYDHIFTSIGFEKDYPAVGFAAGLERLLLASESMDTSPPLRLLIIPIGEAARATAFGILAKVRETIAADLPWTSHSLRSALKRADRLKVPFVAIIGQDELRDKVLLLRNMTSGEQIRLPLDAENLTDRLQKLILLESG